MNSDKNPELIKRMIANAQKQHAHESFLHTTSGTGQKNNRFQGDRRFVNRYKDSEIANRHDRRPTHVSDQSTPAPEAPKSPKIPTSKVGSGFAPSQKRGPVV